MWDKEYDYAQEYLEELRQQSEACRLSNAVRREQRVPFYAPLLLRVGHLLVKCGGFLEKRYDVPRETTPHMQEYSTMR